jgi:hypothetical protein
MLTGQRRQEIASFERSEIHTAMRQIELPAARTTFRATGPAMSSARVAQSKTNRNRPRSTVSWLAERIHEQPRRPEPLARQA